MQKINIRVGEKRRVKDILKNDPIMSQLMTANYNQIDSYVDNNLNSVSDVKEIIKRLLKINKYLLSHLLKELS